MGKCSVEVSKAIGGRVMLEVHAYPEQPGLVILSYDEALEVVEAIYQALGDCPRCRENLGLCVEKRECFPDEAGGASDAATRTGMYDYD